MTATPPRRRRPRLRLRHVALAVALLAAYPVFVLGSVYVHWHASGLPGGRNGPADAYRHALAGATVAYTGSPRWVEWVTAWMEGDGRGSASRAMDAHNNRIGARIGSAASSWSAMHDAVLAAVRAGDVGASTPDQVTWLPPERWSERAY